MTVTTGSVGHDRTSRASFGDKTGDRSGLVLQWLSPLVFVMDAREDALSGPRLAPLHPPPHGGHGLGRAMRANLGRGLETDTQFGPCLTLTLPNLGPVTGHTTRDGLSPPRHGPGWAPSQRQGPKWLPPPRREPTWARHSDTTQGGLSPSKTTPNLGPVVRTQPRMARLLGRAPSPPVDSGPTCGGRCDDMV